MNTALQLQNVSDQALYDPSKTFDENVQHGPFGDFDNADTQYQNSGEPQYEFFGTKVYAPFGIAAGPLPNARCVQAAFDRGFDIAAFKSVRTSAYPCHLFPNVLPVRAVGVDIKQPDASLVMDSEYTMPLPIANSLGVPSSDPDIWQPKLAAACKIVRYGQALLTAFQGTDRGKGPQAFMNDHVHGVRLLREVGARVVELNLSCPNEGSASLLCFDVSATQRIVGAVREQVDDVQLLVKLAYFEQQQQLREFVAQVGPLVDGITAINSLARRVVDSQGRQAFPGGPERSKPGISGQAIKSAGLDMVTRLAALRQECNLTYKIIGVGGVLRPSDFHEYRKRGADVVMAVTGAMWNANLAAQIKDSLPASLLRPTD